MKQAALAGTMRRQPATRAAISNPGTRETAALASGYGRRPHQREDGRSSRRRLSSNWCAQTSVKKVSSAFALRKHQSGGRSTASWS